MTTPNIKTEYFTPSIGTNTVVATSTVIDVVMVYRQIALNQTDYSRVGQVFIFNEAFGQSNGAQVVTESIAITYTY